MEHNRMDSMFFKYIICTNLSANNMGKLKYWFVRASRYDVGLLRRTFSSCFVSGRQLRIELWTAMNAKRRTILTPRDQPKKLLSCLGIQLSCLAYKRKIGIEKATGTVGI